MKRGSSPLKGLAVPIGRAGDTALWAVVNDGVLKVKGCRVLAESRHAGRGSLTFCILPLIHPQKNPHWSGLWIPGNQGVFLETEPAAHRHPKQNPIIQHDMMATVWDYYQQKMRRCFFWHLLLGFCGSEGDFGWGEAVCAGGETGDSKLTYQWHLELLPVVSLLCIYIHRFCWFHTDAFCVSC